MSVQQAPGPAFTRPQDILDSAIGTARAGGRLDIAERLTGARSLLHARPVTVLVTGGAHQGATSVVDALVRTAARTAGPVLTEDPGPAAHAVVFVSDAARPLTAPELDHLHALHRRSPTVLFALTKTDLHPRWRDVLEADLDLLQTCGIRADPFAVSTHLYAHATLAGDRAMIAASGIPALAERLREITEQAEAATARTIAHHVLGAVSALETAPRPRPDTRPPTSAPAPADRARWQQVLADGFAAAASDIDFDLRTRVRGVVAEAERAIDEGDPVRNWDVFDDWLRDRLTYEARQTHALLGERAAQVAASLAEQIGLPPGAALRPVVLPDPPDLLAHLPPRDPPAADRGPLAARGRTLLMSSYGGAMMTLILPRYAGLNIPMWVIAAAAAVAGLLMCGAALSGERKRQLDKRRGQAKALVRHCTDGFLLSAGKHTRDALRYGQQQLRDECATRTAERQRPTPPPREPGRPARPAAGPDDDLAALRRQALTLLGPGAPAA
ncbi:hypothetical protein ACVGVM_16490 [Pseudonocardia bannensis]|uniref:Dynamin family protein n=1 Tax=Pseudonocardia bannensis TaxID=630973 RepID=A0A848DQH5_9PSEU|nr:hypothetical protein [Pseudonocardia bannensis]NMH95052.1 hypothetical protein [Pseudonocardia bannensis]